MYNCAMRTKKFRTFKSYIQSASKSVQTLTANEISDNQLIEFEGKTYKSYPCVALVQGVLQGSNADAPELALAEAFGMFDAAGWNGRPLVLNHPKVNGVFVSANHPEVLNDWKIGYIFNARMQEEKLLVDAWIDTENESAELADIMTKLDEGELVEVSTGLFSEIIPQSGIYEGKKYAGVWSNVVPDHLAVLSLGVVGACSISDGCGIPRINTKDTEMNNVNLFANKGKKQKNCSGDSGSCNCGCDKGSEPVNINANQAGEQHSAIERFLANALPGNLVLRDVRQILEREGSEYLKKMKDFCNAYYIWLAAATTEVAVFEIEFGNFYQVGYMMDSDGNVTFDDNIIEVNLLERIVIKNDTDEGNNMSATPANPSVQNAAQPASVTEVVSPGAGVPTQEVAPTTPSEGQTVVNTVVTPGEAAPKVHNSIEEFIASAPAVFQSQLLEGLERVNSYRTDLVNKISTNSANKFTAEQLNAMETSVLEGISAIANVNSAASQQPNAASTVANPAAPTNPTVNSADSVFNYAGVIGGPSSDLSVNERFTAAPKVFESASK